MTKQNKEPSQDDGILRMPNGGYLKPWKKGQTGNPDGRKAAWADIERQVLSATKVNIEIVSKTKGGEEKRVAINLSCGQKKTFRHR